MNKKQPFALIPERNEFSGNPSQPANIPSGKKMSKSIELKGSEVFDPTLPGEIFIPVYETLAKLDPKKKLELQTMKLQAMVAQKAKTSKYKVVHTQWWEAIENEGLTARQTNEITVSFEVGQTKTTAHTTQSTLGIQLGTSTTSGGTASASFGGSVSAPIEGVEVGADAKVGGGFSFSKTTQKTISNTLQITLMDSTTNSTSHTVSKKVKIEGGETGARFVTWQLKDQVEVIRLDDNVTISDEIVASKIETRRYEYGEL